MTYEIVYHKHTSIARIKTKVFDRTFHFGKTSYNYGTIIQTEIACKKVPLQKSIEFDITLKYISTHFKQKAIVFLVTRPLTC